MLMERWNYFRHFERLWSTENDDEERWRRKMYPSCYIYIYIVCIYYISISVNFINHHENMSTIRRFSSNSTVWTESENFANLCFFFCLSKVPNPGDITEVGGWSYHFIKVLGPLFLGGLTGTIFWVKSSKIWVIWVLGFLYTYTVWYTKEF